MWWKKCMWHWACAHVQIRRLFRIRPRRLNLNGVGESDYGRTKFLLAGPICCFFGFFGERIWNSINLEAGLFEFHLDLRGRFLLFWYNKSQYEGGVHIFHQIWLTYRINLLLFSLFGVGSQNFPFSTDVDLEECTLSYCLLGGPDGSNQT